MLHLFTEKWAQAQLTHQVSISAANAFWSLAFENVCKIHQLKGDEGIRKGIPQFVHMRRVMYKEACPKIWMSFTFKNLDDGSIITVQDDHTPLSRYQRDPKYQKLYEEAHIKVKLYFAVNMQFEVNMQFATNSF